MKLKVVQLTEDKKNDWDKFCASSHDAWFWHTFDWIKYILNYKTELSPQNFSFLVYSGQDKIQAIVPLVLETYDINGKQYNEFSYGTWMTPTPALDNSLTGEKKDQVLEHIFKHIDKLAKEYQIGRAKFGQTPLSPAFLNKEKPINYLLKYGYGDISLVTQLIDLKKIEDNLWDDMRRNHRRNIKKADGYEAIIYTSKNITREIFDDYKKMHFLASGRQTRPDITFDLMFDWLKQDQGFLVAVAMDGKIVGYEYYTLYKNSSNGASAANHPDYAKLPIRHFLEWEAILWMKNQGLDYYEIGLHQYSILPYDFPEQKKLDISHFKKGFGGITVPMFMAEKYFNKEYFLKINNIRAEKFVKYLEETYD